VSDTVFIVDADDTGRLRITRALRGFAGDVHTFTSAEQFIDQLHGALSGCALVATDLPDAGARAVIAAIAARRLPIAVVAVDRRHDLALAVELVRAGAVDVLEYPLTARHLQSVVRRILRRDS
jgi:FixJ family two-component response regulator